MNLQCDPQLASGYRSGSQIARVVTEAWCTRELYCVACDCDRLEPAPANTEALDFECAECHQGFQLKSRRGWSERKVVDASYEAMLRAIRADRSPNLLLLEYTPAWKVVNLLLVPRFFFSEASLEKRKPLASTARRAGWIGCNILLDKIPLDGKLRLVQNGIPAAKTEVRARYQRVEPLSKVPPTVRGWTLDVLDAIRQLKKERFTLAELYALEGSLQYAHPANRNVRPKIRQQLQVLRDLGLIEFQSPGHYILQP